MVKNRYLLYILTLICVGSIISCNDQDPVIENPEELITSLVYELEDLQTGEIDRFSFVDLDGDGGISPVIQNIELNAMSEYAGQIILLNESVNPVEDIGEEVREEAEDHQFFFEISGVNAEIMYTDSDTNGNPLGLESQFTTGNAGTGSLMITLRHEPDKNAEGVSDGIITNAGGETDIQVVFDLVIQ